MTHITIARLLTATITWLEPLIGATPIGEARQPLRVKRMLKVVEEARGEAALQQARVAVAPIEGMAWKYRTGAPWRDVPERFGKWNSIYKRFNW